MQAKETKLQDIIEGTKQYVVPLFQRTYSWTNHEWNILWKDIVELCESENPRSHFIGSIVNMPTISVPEGVNKYMLIDGQQRLTTIFILLTLLRNKAREQQNNEFADEINETLLVNPFKKDNDFFKLMPTQVDREAYQNFIKGKPNTTDSPLTKAYDFFEKKLRQNQLDHEKLKKILTSNFSVVSIVLDADDNPYLVFESLNAKGRVLTQADLIRNYFFMRIHVNKQDEVYQEYWQPMQVALGDNLTEYIRHYLMKSGKIVKEGDVYYTLKEGVTATNAIDYLINLNKFSDYYQRLINPDSEPDKDIKKYLNRLKRIEVTTVYPLLLNVYSDYASNKLSKSDFITVLTTLENYLIRRFVCNIPSHGLNKIFPLIYPQITAKNPNDFVEELKLSLQSKSYPKDPDFFTRFKETKFYGAGERLTKTKLILETFEEKFAHKEAVPFDNLTIEHIMPRTLTDVWKKHLGEDWEATHEILIDTIGNLTLTAYNPELSNDDYQTKRQRYNESHLEINGYFSSITSWTRVEIERRADLLAKQALNIWNYFGKESSSTAPQTEDVTGTTPTAVRIMGQEFQVQTWRDVLEQTLNTVADLEPEKFDIIACNFPRYLSKDKDKFRASRQLQNGYYVEVNLSAQTIRKLCYQAIETIELTSEEWTVTVT